MKRDLLRKWKFIALLAVLSVGGQSCSDFFDVDSKHEASESQQWQTLEDTRAALMGIYGLMRTALIDNNTLWAAGDLRCGDFTVRSRKDLQAIADNDLNLNIRLIDDIADWNRFYAVINAANVFIERAYGAVDKDQSYSEENLNYDLAQARAIRALAYMTVARIWGDAPLVTISYDNGTFPDIPQSPAETLLEYARQEFLSVVDQIPFEYGTGNSYYYRQNAEYWRGKLINKVGVYAMLAHISAMLGNYTDVELYSSFVIDHLTNVGISESNRILSVSNLVSSVGYFCGSVTSFAGNRLLAFNFTNSGNETTATGHLEEWTLAYPYVSRRYPDIYLSKATLASMFDDTNDLRYQYNPEEKVYSQEGYIDMNNPFPIFKKVNVVQDGSNEDGDYAVFGSSVCLSRAEDMILLQAEALAVLNRASDALTSLNSLRVARGLKELSFKNDLGQNREKLLEEIFKERRRELIGEGMAWYDLIRRQKLLGGNDEMQRLIDTGGIYWPVATEVLANNPLITQNSYWK